MPDGSIATDLRKAQRQTNSSVEEAKPHSALSVDVAQIPYIRNQQQASVDLVFLSSFMPATPLASRLMASACHAISNTKVGPFDDERLFDLEDVCDHVALTLPVTTLNDAVAVMGVVVHEMERLEDFELDKSAQEISLANIRRALEGSLPFLAGASDISLGEIGCDCFTMADRERARRAMHLPVASRGIVA